ncbi:MAG: hypothetical protein HY717_21905 [Planctomycetes bacterium]|nr:hypothetical protein [Planctomycetota bacterium]
MKCKVVVFFFFTLAIMSSCLSPKLRFSNPQEDVAIKNPIKGQTPLGKVTIEETTEDGEIGPDGIPLGGGGYLDFSNDPVAQEAIWGKMISR